jgi:hypothetical protein
MRPGKIFAALPRVPRWAAALCCGATPLVSSGPAAAEEPPPQLIQELFAGEVAYPQERHELQGQVGWSRTASAGGVEQSFPITAEFGITDRWQIGVEIPFVGSRAGAGAAGGLGNIEAEVLYNFLSDSQRNLLLTAVLSGAAPAVSEGAGERGGEVELTLAALKGTGRLYVNANLAAQLAIDGQDGDVQVGGRAAAALFVDAGPVVPVLEVVGRIEDGAPEALFAWGLRWHPGANFELGMGAWLRTDGATSSHGLMSDCVWELELDDDD